MKPIVFAVTARVDAELYLEKCASCQGKDGPSKDRLADAPSAPTPRSAPRAA